MKNFFTHTKMYILRGLLAIIPLALSVLTVQFIYVLIDKRIMGLMDQYIGHRIPGLGILVVLIMLYLIGLIASNVMGRKFFCHRG